jgi:hypothetical protein
VRKNTYWTRKRSIGKPCSVSTHSQLIVGYDIPIAYQSIHPVITRAEVAELDLFAICDFFSVAVAPLKGHIRVGISVHKHVERAVSV